MTNSPGSEPTLGEVVRRLDEVSRQLVAVAQELKDDRNKAAEIYVRKDVYVAERKTDAAVDADLHGDIASLRTEFEREVQALKEDRTRDVGFRRQAVLAAAIAGVGWIVTIAIAIVGFLGK